MSSVLTMVVVITWGFVKAVSRPSSCMCGGARRSGVATKRECALIGAHSLWFGCLVLEHHVGEADADSDDG